MEGFLGIQQVSARMRPKGCLPRNKNPQCVLAVEACSEAVMAFQSGSTAKVHGASTGGRGPATRAVKLLIIDDSADDAARTIRALHELGFDPTCRIVAGLADLKAALKSEPWDAVLSEFTLAGFTGIEALQIVRSTGLDIPFVILSATIDDEVAAAAMRAGASGCVMRNDFGRLDRTLERELKEVAMRAADRRTYAEAQQRIAKLSQAIEQSPAATMITDTAGRIEYVNPRFVQVCGYSSEELIGRTPSVIKSGLTPDEVYRDLWGTLKAGRSWRGRLQNRRKGGELYWEEELISPLRDEQGVIVNFIAVKEDITDRMHAHQALVESERRYVDMLQNVDFVAMMLDREGNITFCNDSLLRLTGWRREDVMGRSWFETFIPTQDESLRATFAELLRDEPAAYHHENEIQTRAGERRLISWNNTLLRAGSGEIIGTASIGEDITDYRDSVNEIRRLNTDLERRVAERTAELETANKELQAFAHSVSHDLRAPLNRIRGFSRILVDANSAARDARDADLLRRIDSAGRDMEQLIGDLLDLSRVGTGELRRMDVDISRAVSLALERLKGEGAPRDADVHVEAGMTARADPGLVAIVLDNLLGNAWKFTSRRSPARIEVGTEMNGDSERSFFVRDNGAGFDITQAEKLFVPFQRLHAKSEFDGTGIGLATVQRIVRRHGGRVWAEGAVDRGATFHFTLAP